MLAQSRTLTDAMIIAGTRRLASLAPALSNPEEALLPDFGDSPAITCINSMKHRVLFVYPVPMMKIKRESNLLTCPVALNTGKNCSNS